VGINADGGEVEEIGKGQRGPKPGSAMPRKKTVVSAHGDEHIKEHIKGYAKEKERFLFVLNTDGSIRDFRLEEPLLHPIYELMKKERGYGGDFPQFMADAVETLFASAGYELTLAPKSQSAIYQEVVRLIKEGQLELVDREGQIVLGVKNGHKVDGAKGRDSLGSEEAGGEFSRKEG